MSQFNLLKSKTNSSYSILFGAVNLTFPTWESNESEWRLPLTNISYRIQYPGIYFATLFYLGIGAAAYLTSKRLACLFQRTSTYLKSFGNAKKFKSARKNDVVYTAVIYGASTTVGKMFALYLAQQGFNLILIEREMNQLNMLEVNLTTDLLNPPKITKVVIDKFD